MSNLVSTYSELGRYSDALSMQESVLDFMRRILPADCPRIGEGHVGNSCCKCFSDRCVSLVLMRRHGHEQPSADI